MLFLRWVDPDDTNMDFLSIVAFKENVRIVDLLTIDMLLAAFR